MTQWGGCWNNDNEDEIRELYGLPPRVEREYTNEEEMDYFEELSCMCASPTYPDKPQAYRRLYRRGMTECKIKRRLFQLLKDRDWSSHLQPWWWGKYDYEDLYANKYEIQPHRMHKKYAYEKDKHDDWDYYAYLYYNRAKEKVRNRKTLEEYPCDLCTGNMAWEEDVWNDQEYYNYYEVYSYYWEEWQIEKLEEMWHRKEELFYKVGQRLDWNKREELDILYHKLSKGE